MAQGKRFWLLLTFVFAITIAWYFLWSPITPKGQPPLTRLADDSSFVSQFNRTASNIRMVLLLSPT
jgi:hypothetical protein